MSLRTKFSVVLALLGFTLAVNVALSVWSIRFLEQELAWPLRSAQPVLSGLHQIKRLGEQQTHELGHGRRRPVAVPDAKTNRPEAERLAPLVIESEQTVVRQLERMAKLDSLLLRSGVSTTQNLRSRSDQIMQLARDWGQQQEPNQYERLVSLIEARHELIERIEGRIIDDAQLAADYGRRIKAVILIIIGVSVIGAGVSAAFAVVLLKRWILTPVQELRAGARRLGSGDFSYRLAIDTGDELGQLGAEFNHMAKLIKTMQDERVERERLAAMGEMAQRTVHNLRTPLSGIRALAETTKHELEPSSDLREIQDRIIQTIDRFESWLQGMLRVSAPLDLQIQEYSPQALVRGVIESHRSAAARRGVRIELTEQSTPRVAQGDPSQLEHAMTALLSNAIEFSDEGSTIRVGIGSSEGYWTLSVEDEGRGIPHDLQVAVFRPYFTTRKDGTGIGLAMVKRIVEQHQGSVEIQSPTMPDSGTGTAFRVSIPIDDRGKEA